MSDGEDDYLSDKFLLETTPQSSTSTKTYSQLRKDADKKYKLKNQQNRMKSRRERELEAREEGLSKSLFARAREDEESGGAENKALSIMMKMGFKPGQSLGKIDDNNQGKVSPPPTSSEISKDRNEGNESNLSPLGASTPTEISSVKEEYSHRTEPLPLTEWAGESTC